MLHLCYKIYIALVKAELRSHSEAAHVRIIFIVLICVFFCIYFTIFCLLLFYGNRRREPPTMRVCAYTFSIVENIDYDRTDIHILRITIFISAPYPYKHLLKYDTRPGYSIGFHQFC